MTGPTPTATPEPEQPNRFWVFLGFQFIACSALWNPKKAHQIWRDHCAEEPKRKQREIDAKMHSLSRPAPKIRKGVTGASEWGPAHELIASAELARLREKVAELEKDRETLDWLEQVACEVEFRYMKGGRLLRCCVFGDASNAVRHSVSAAKAEETGR